MDTKNVMNAATNEQEIDMDFATIFMNIYMSCDCDSTNSVLVSKLIDFIRPYMLENLSALEELHVALDPEKKNISISNDLFMEVMAKWSQKLASGSSDLENDFNRTPNHLNVLDDKDLPYTHSTPRASLGDKLLKCKDLLNLSNISAYSLSTSKLEDTNSDRTPVLEEEIKRLQHQLSKTVDELSMTRQQLAVVEDQNEALQADIDRLNKKFISEQHILEQLQKDKIYIEGLREEIVCCKKVSEELKKKLAASEKNTIYLNELLKDLEKEKCILENRNETFCRQRQDALKEIFEIKTTIESKDQEIAEIKKNYADLKVRCSEQRDLIDQLEDANDILEHQRYILENTLKGKSAIREDSNILGNAFQGKYQKLAHNVRIKSNTNLLRQLLVKHSTPEKRPEQNVVNKDPLSCLANNPCISSPDSDDVSLRKSLIVRNNTAGCNEANNSSEEDVAWKIPSDKHEEDNNKHEEDNNIQYKTNELESLQSELERAIPIDCEHSTALYEHDEQIMELEEVLDNCKEKIKYMKKESEACAMNLKVKNRDPKEIDQSIIILGSELKICKDQIQNLQIKLPTMCNREVNMFDNEIVTEGDDLMTELCKKVEHLNKECYALRAQLKDLKAINSALIIQMENSEKENEKLKAEDRDINIKYVILLEEITKLKSREEELRNEISDNELKLQDLELDNQKLRQMVTDISCENTQLKEETGDIVDPEAKLSGAEVRSKLRKNTSKGDYNVDRKTSFWKQQVLIEKLKEKLECIETQLSKEKKKNNEFTNKLKSSTPPLCIEQDEEKVILEELKVKLSKVEKKCEIIYAESLAKDYQIYEAKEKYEKLLEVCQSEDLKRRELRETEERLKVCVNELNLLEEKLRQKKEDILDQSTFTKSQTNSVKRFERSPNSRSCPSSPDSPSEDIPKEKLNIEEVYLIQLPSFKFSDFCDQFLEEIGLSEESSGNKFSKNEMEKMVTTLAVRFLLNSQDLKQRLIDETNKYKFEYNSFLSVFWDISHRLREHRCTGTSKLTKAVFVLLEELMLRLSDLLLTTGQVGILVHEGRMRKCWNLATNYMATLRQENEELQNRGDRRENFSGSGLSKERISCKTKLLVVLSTGAVAIISSLCIVLHLNCRLTSSETQYCPLDGMITRQAIGFPPM